MSRLLLRSCFRINILFCCFCCGLVMFHWCVCDVPMMPRWWRYGDASPRFRNALCFSRLGVVSALFWCYFVDVRKVFRWCFNDVSVMLWWCRDVVSVVSRCFGDVAGCRVLCPWWFSGGTLLCWFFGRCRNDVWVTSRGGIANVSVSLNCLRVDVPVMPQLYFSGVSVTWPGCSCGVMTCKCFWDVGAYHWSQCFADVPVTSRRCFVGVTVVSRWCPGVSQCFADVVVSGRYLGHVWFCCVYVSWMSQWCVGLVY